MEERIALRIARWRNLSSLEKNLDERFEKEINPWWTIMYSLHEETPVTKEWSNEKKEKLKIQGETL